MTTAAGMLAHANWRRGYDLDLLRALAAPFKERHKRLCFGAFSLIKERDIAAALAEDNLHFTGSPAQETGITAAAIAKRLGRASAVRDFTGREIVLPGQTLVISAFACIDVQSGARLIRTLLAHGGCACVEIFEEDDTAKEAVRLLPALEYAATKITAGSEVKGLYMYPHAMRPPAHAAEEMETLRVCVQEFASPPIIDRIRKEITAHAEWAQHYSSYNKRQSWTAFALRGYDENDPSFIICPREMSQSWKADNERRLHARCANTIAAERFPTAMRLADCIPGHKDRIRLMRLAPAGALSRHADITDRQAGVKDGAIARLHIPITTNPTVQFRAWDARGQQITLGMPEGSLCYLDQRKPHAVDNIAAAERIHLVVDTIATAPLRAMLFP